MENQNKKKIGKYRIQEIMLTLMPGIALLVLFLMFCIAVISKEYMLSLYLKIIFNEGVVLALVATGAVFIYTLGSFDISLGASTLLSATLGVMTYNTTENLALMIIVIFATGIGCSLLSSLLASVFNIPVFVTTVAMMSVLSAISAQLITSNGGALGGISIPATLLKGLDNPPFKIVVLALWFAICLFVFNFTIGSKTKASAQKQNIIC